MFGINSNGDISTQDATATGPMVPDGDGVDHAVQVPEPPADAPTPSAPPMPQGPSAAAMPAVSDEPPAALAAPVVHSPAHDDLIQLKQQALQNLAPLVDQLDQTPEEKFKTTMMMLQASDNPELVKDAYAAANAISDEKLRAQALLDVVNEINYFTQHNASSGQAAA